MDSSTARVRLWVVAQARPSPTGKRFLLSSERFAAELAAATSGVKVSVPDRLGNLPERTFEISFGKLRVFQVSEIASAVPLLRSLKGLVADAPPADRFTSRLKELVGDGPLLDAVTAALSGAPAPAPAAPAGALTPEAVLGDLSTKSTASSAIDAFVRSGRPAGAPDVKPAAGASARAAAAVDAAIHATARDVLASPAVSRLESLWRSLRLLTEQCPEASRIAVEVLDLSPADAPAALEREMPGDAFDRPDALFIAEPTSDLDLLRRLAELGESYNVPVVADVVPAAALGRDDLGGDLPQGAQLPEGWQKLRAEESARWLCAAVNRVALLVEPGHACLGSPALAVAAMLAQSFRLTDGFGRAIGRQGELQAPAALKSDAGYQAPTETWLSSSDQGELASRGLLALGSAKSSDRLVLSSGPTVRGSPDAMPLPGQIVTGRLVRFAQWVRDQLPAGVSAKEVTDLFGEAAQVFLFAGATGMGQIRAELVEGERRAVRVSAALPAAHAGSPFEVAFDLPLRVS
jgi:hypothetical protein